LGQFPQAFYIVVVRGGHKGKKDAIWGASGGQGEITGNPEGLGDPAI
jgi:hypothetical protein